MRSLKLPYQADVTSNVTSRENKFIHRHFENQYDQTHFHLTDLQHYIIYKGSNWNVRQHIFSNNIMLLKTQIHGRPPES